MSTINRSGKVSFHDASLHVWEEPGGQVQPQWEAQFKKDVFLRVVQQLNRLGWTCTVPQDMLTQYSLAFARMHRYCRKGDLQAELGVGGRHIELKMWQDVANVTHRSGGKYEFDKEQKMPYLLRLEMERTRRRIRDYLCGVFSDYSFTPPKPTMGLSGVTAMEYAAHSRRTSGHYVAELDRARICNGGYDKSADGHQLENGVQVYAQDRRGRIITGIAFYDLNGNWQVVTGRYGMNCVWYKQVWISSPGNLRVKRNADIRRKRLEGELSKAVVAMNFERAATLRDILFPKGDPLFMVFHQEHDAYHGPAFSGYTKDASQAGKFTAAEIAGWNRAPNRVVPVI